MGDQCGLGVGPRQPVAVGRRCRAGSFGGASQTIGPHRSATDVTGRTYALRALRIGARTGRQRTRVASALMFSLSLITANAKGCPSGHVSGHCAATYHQVRSSMGGAFMGAYHRWTNVCGGIVPAAVELGKEALPTLSR